MTYVRIDYHANNTVIKAVNCSGEVVYKTADAQRAREYFLNTLYGSH